MVDVDDLVDVLQSFYRFVGQRFLQRAVEVLAEDGVERLVDERALAAAADTRDADELAQRYLYAYATKVVTRCTVQSQAEAVAFPSLGRRLDAEGSLHVAAGERLFLQHLGVGALEDHLASASACQGADVDDVVGVLYHLAVVLHYDDGVAAVAQGFERADELDVVALVKADARFVKDVKDSHQLAANLCGKADALTFTARETHRGAREGEVLQSDIEQEAESCANLLDDFLCDGPLAFGQFAVQVAKPFIELTEVVG